MKRKVIVYNYPGSSIADSAGYEHGCYSVEIQDRGRVAAHHHAATFVEAFEVASALPHPWRDSTVTITINEATLLCHYASARQDLHTRAARGERDAAEPTSARDRLDATEAEAATEAHTTEAAASPSPDA